VFVQFALGVTVIWTARFPHVTSLHVATGAMVLAAATLLAARAYDLTPEPESAEGRVPNRETAPVG
jgi:heme A synthase